MCIVYRRFSEVAIIFLKQLEHSLLIPLPEQIPETNIGKDSTGEKFTVF
jgi:hypothetical protein